MRDTAIIKTHELGDYWESIYDQSFICQVGQEEFFKKHNITHNIMNHRSLRDRADIGYCALFKTWFHWSPDFQHVWCVVETEIKNDYDRPRKWTSFGFKGGMDKIIDIAASHYTLRSTR